MSTACRLEGECHPVRAAARSAAAQTRERATIKAPLSDDGPASALQHFVPQRVRDDTQKILRPEPLADILSLKQYGLVARQRG